MIELDFNSENFIPQRHPYDVMVSCNACGAEGSNDVTVEDTINYHICEATTKCKLCGHEDYWAYGSFMSNEHIEGKAKKY